MEKLTAAQRKQEAEDRIDAGIDYFNEVAFDLKNIRIKELEVKKELGKRDNKLRGAADIELTKRIIRAEIKNIIIEGDTTNMFTELLKRLKGKRGKVTIGKYWRECERQVRQDFIDKFEQRRERKENK